MTMKSGLAAICSFVIFAIRLSAQCFLSCPTADDAVIQSMLDASTGTVQLDGRVYHVCSARIVGSNTHLRGAGKGATIIRAVSSYTGRTVSNSYVSSLIGAVGANNVTVSDLTIDTFTCGVHANALSLLPTSTTASAYDGAVVTNATVRDVEVAAAPGFHAYQVWNLKGQHVKFLNNWIDGNSTSQSTGGQNQEGLESYGGYDVLMSGNTVKNIGYACVTIGSGSIAASDIHGVRVVDNYLSGCTIGVQVTAAAVYDGEANAHTLIRGNVIVDSRMAGIDVPVDVGSYERDLQITGNTIRNVTNSLAAGIWLRSNGGLAIGPESVIGTLVANNHVESVTGANSFGIYLLNYPKARVLDNTIIGTASDGIRVYNSSDTEIVGNRITSAGNTAIGVYRTGSLTSARVMVERNRINDWSPFTSGVLVLGTSRGTVKDNVFARADAATPGPITVTSGSCGFSISGNVPWYLPSYTQPTTAGCP